MAYQTQRLKCFKLSEQNLECENLFAGAIKKRETETVAQHFQAESKFKYENASAYVCECVLHWIKIDN